MPVGTQAPGESYTMTDFSLFHHYMTSTGETMLNDDSSAPWVPAIPDLATRCPYLLQEILAVSAIHLHHLQPDNPEGYERLAQEHHAQALSLFRKALSLEDAPSHSQDLFACSALIMRFYFAAFKDPAALLFNEGSASLPEWVFPLRGCVALVHQFSDELKTGPMGEMLQTYSEACDDDGFQFAQSESDDQIQLLGRRLGAMTSPQDQAVCGPALAQLRKCFTIAERGDIISLKAGTFSFAATVSTEFLHAMSKERRPSALVVMGFWCVLLGRVPSKWWLRGTSAAPDVLDMIRSSLPPQFIELLQWPTQQISRSGDLDMEER